MNATIFWSKEDLELVTSIINTMHFRHVRHRISMIWSSDPKCDSNCTFGHDVDRRLFARSLVVLLREHQEDILSSPVNRQASNLSLVIFALTPRF